MSPRRNPFALILFLVVLTSSGIAQSPLANPSPRTGLLLRDDVTRLLIQRSSGDLAHNNVVRLSLWDRSQVTEGYGESAEWIADQAGKYGLDQVQVEKFPSGTGVEYFGNPTEKLWQVKKGELWMTAPFELRMTTYAELPMSLARNSVTAEFEADLVDVGRGTKDEDYRTDVRGKIVLTESSPGGIWSLAVVKRGAAGIISSWSVPGFDFLNRLPGDRPDQVGWGRIPETKVGDTSHPAFLVSSRRAQELKQLLAQGKAVRMRMIVDAGLTGGTLDVVSGVITGSTFPTEEIVVTAHLDHYKPGANDNASGAASVLEIVRTLNELIAAGTIPRPLRTIRFLWVPEYMGSWAWLSKHQADPVLRIANLNFDMLGENLMTTNAKFSIGYTPDSNPSWLNGLMASVVGFLNRYNDDRYPAQKDFQVISVLGTRNRLKGTMEPASVGTDHELFNNLKIPGTGPSGWPDDFYHSSEDSPEKTDPTQLHRVIVVGLTALTLIAYADDRDAASFALQSLEHGRLRIAESVFQAAQLVLSSTAESLADNARRARSIVGHVYRRERECVRSASVFARTDRTRSIVEAIAANLDEEERQGLRAMDDRIVLRARDLGVARPTVAVTDAERRLSRMIPSRVSGKELFSSNWAARTVMADSTLRIRELSQWFNAAMTRMRADGTPELRLMGAVEALAYYADAKRSLADIREDYAAEYTLLTTENVEVYFRMLEKAGLLQFRRP